MKMKLLVLLALIESIQCLSQFEFHLNQYFNQKNICLNLERSNISTNCREQLDESCTNGTVLTLLMDASSKFPFSGLHLGRQIDLGNYYECTQIHHEYNNGSILGKYCKNSLILNGLSDITNKKRSFKLATCIPDKCTGNDYNTILSTLYPSEFPGYFDDKLCVTNEDRQITTGSLIVFAVFLSFIIIILLSTGYDYYLRQNELKCHHPLLLAFSLIVTLTNVCQTKKSSKDQIVVFQAFRIISTTWIIFGHAITGFGFFPLINRIDFEENHVGKWYHFYSEGFHSATDTFFYMSGFLVAYNYLKGRKKPVLEQIKGIPRFIIHRYIRLVPPVIMIYLFQHYFHTYWTTGPLEKLTLSGSDCGSMWKYLLFVQNYQPGDEICNLPTWYLSADMQMYFFSPLILIPLCVIMNKSGFKLSLIFLFVVNVIFYIVPSVIAYFSPFHENYYETHPRLITFGCGIMMGTFMSQKRNLPFLNRNKYDKSAMILNSICWVLVLIAMFLYIYYYALLNLRTAPLSVILIRPIWCLGLSWIVYSCYHGKGGPVNWILTLPILQMGGNISYAMYISQTFGLSYYTMSASTNKHFSDIEIINFFIDGYLLDILLALFFHSAFIAPVAVIDKVIFESKLMRAIGIGQAPRPLMEAPTKESTTNSA